MGFADYGKRTTGTCHLATSPTGPYVTYVDGDSIVTSPDRSKAKPFSGQEARDHRARLYLASGRQLNLYMLWIEDEPS